MHLHDAFDILRSDDGGPARLLLSDDAAQVDDTVANDYAHAEGAPVVLLDRIDDAIANMVVVGLDRALAGHGSLRPGADWHE